MRSTLILAGPSSPCKDEEGTSNLAQWTEKQQLSHLMAAGEGTQGQGGGTCAAAGEWRADVAECAGHLSSSAASCRRGGLSLHCCCTSTNRWSRITAWLSVCDRRAKDEFSLQYRLPQLQGLGFRVSNRAWLERRQREMGQTAVLPLHLCDLPAALLRRYLQARKIVTH